MNIDSLLQQLEANGVLKKEENQEKSEDNVKKHAADILGISVEKFILLGKFAENVVMDEEMDGFAKVSFFLANIDMVITREENSGSKRRLIALVESAISNMKK